MVELTHVPVPASLLRLKGHSLPLLGLGIYQNSTDCYSACIAALKAGYRYAALPPPLTCSSTPIDLPSSLLTTAPLLRRHIDSAQVYRNEAEVGRAVRDAVKDLGIKREEIFVSTYRIGDGRGLVVQAGRRDADHSVCSFSLQDRLAE